MNDRWSTRRRFLRAGGVVGALGLAGCLRMGGGGSEATNTIQDTDGDGVIDSEDYAPRDPEVQRAEQVKDGPSTRTEATTSTRSDESPTGEPRPTPTGDVVSEGQLISRWPFDSGLADTVGDNDASAEIGRAPVGTHDGRRAVRFDGDAGVMVEEGPNEELSIMKRGSGPATIAGWVYFDRDTGSRDAAGETPRHHIFRNDAEYLVHALPTDRDGTVELSFGVSSQRGAGYTTVDRTDDEMYVGTNEWRHFAYVVEPEGSLTFYLDGRRRFHDDDMTGYSPNVSDYWSHETIGSWYGTGNPDWYDLLVGKLADLRIYDAGLSDDGVAQIHANTS